MSPRRRASIGTWSRRSVVLAVSTALCIGMLSTALPNQIGLPGISLRPASAAALGSSGAEIGSEPFWSLRGSDLGAGWTAAVNTFTGNLLVQGPLAGLSGRGPSLSDGLAYNSQASANLGLGAGWQPASAQQLTVNPDSSVSIRDADGTINTVTHNADGSYTSPPGLHLTLTATGSGTYTLSTTDKTISTFTGGWLASVADAQGETLTYTRNASGGITTETDASGRKLTYGYDASGRLATVTDPAGQVTTLGYDSGSRLISVTDPTGAATQFGYTSGGQLGTVTDANGGVTTVFYDATGAITKVDDPRTTPTSESATSYSYNVSTLVTTVTDPAGKSSSITHNSAGNPTQVTDAAGVTTTTTWVNNEVTKASDAAGSTTTSYDANGNATATSDTISPTQTATTSATYDANNNPTSVTDAANRRLDLRYDPRSNLRSVASATRKEADANTYDANGNLTGATDSGAGTGSLLSNGSFETTDPTTHVATNWTYGGVAGGESVDTSTSTFGQASLKLTAPGTTAATAYASSAMAPVAPGTQLTLSAKVLMGNVAGNGAHLGMEFYDANYAFLGSSYTNEYTGSGNLPFQVTGTAPANTTYVTAIAEMDTATGSAWFDGVQLEAPLASAEGPVLSAFDYVNNSSFESGGTNWTAGGATGAVSIDATDAWGGARSAQVALSATNTAYLVNAGSIPVLANEPLTLSAALKTTSVTGTGARVQVQFYDSTGANIATYGTAWLTGTTDWTRYAVAAQAPATAVSARVYAPLSNGTGTVRVDNLKLTPRATTTYAYDSGGNYPTSVTDPLGNSASYSYDAHGNLTSGTDASGGVTATGYDADNRPTAITDATGAVTRFAYDKVGNGVTVRDPRSASSTDNTYATGFGYDPVRHRTAITDPLGRITGYGYDKAGNLSAVTNPSTSTVSYGYDGAGKPTTKALSDGDSFTYGYTSSGDLNTVTNKAGQSYNFSYDAAHRLTGLTTPSGYQQTATLDPAGATTAVSDSDSKTVTYGYGSDGKQLTVTDSAGRTTGYYYDEAGRVFQTVRGDGSVTASSYDYNGRPATIADPGNPGGFMLYYGYDSRGNMTSASANGKQSFGYDSLNRLTSWTNEAGSTLNYGYDKAGDLTTKGTQTWTVDPAGQITNPGYTYDANGNLTSDGVHTYRYDAQHHLQHAGKTDGTTIADYTYDTNGLRLTKTTPAGTTKYDWTTTAQLARETAPDGTITHYNWSSAGELVAIERAGATYYPHTNARGDILSITDANRATVATYSYGPWGELLSSTGTFTQPWRYAGYYYDTDSGLYYLQQRYYDPNLARFLTPEPIYSDFCTDCGFTALLNRAPLISAYAYASDRPTLLIDPDGRWPRWLKWVGRHIKKHWRGIVETVVAGGCIVVTAGACAVASIAMIGAEAWDDYHNRHLGWKRTSINAAEGIFVTGFEFGLGKAAAKGIEGLGGRVSRHGAQSFFDRFAGRTTHYRRQPWGQYAINAFLGLPSVAQSYASHIPINA